MSEGLKGLSRFCLNDSQMFFPLIHSENKYGSQQSRSQ